MTLVRRAVSNELPWGVRRHKSGRVPPSRYPDPPRTPCRADATVPPLTVARTPVNVIAALRAGLSMRERHFTTLAAAPKRRNNRRSAVLLVSRISARPEGGAYD